MTATERRTATAELWAAFGAMESWFAMASSPDGRVFARTWTDGSGHGATSLLDLDTGRQEHATTTGTVVALACAGPKAWAALTVSYASPQTMTLEVRHGTAAREYALTDDRWRLVVAGGERFAAVPLYGTASHVLLADADGHERVDLDGLVLTSVAGADDRRLYVNAEAAPGDVRLATVDLHDGRVEWADASTLAVIVDGPWLVTTTKESPDHAALTRLDEAGEQRQIDLSTHRGDVSLRAVSPDGTQLLMGVHRGLDDACVLVDVASGHVRRLNDEETSFGLACFFFRGVPHWAESSPGGSPALRSTAGALLGGRTLGWTEHSDVVRLPTEDGTHEIEALVLSPAPDCANGVVVVCLHGGPRSRWSRKYDQLHQLLVGAGATVVAPNTRGSSSEDRSFERALRGRWGDVDRRDLVTVARWVESRYPGRPRVVLGQSYGAYLAFQCLLAEPRLWDAAVLASGFSRPEELVERGPEATRSSLVSQQAVPSTWAGGGDAQRCDGLRTWVVHGEVDEVVPLEFGQAVHGTLLDLGADARLTVAAAAGHQPFAGDEALHAELVDFVQECARLRETRA